MIRYTSFQKKLLFHRLYRIKNLLLAGLLWLAVDMMLQQVVEFGLAIAERTTPFVYVFLLSNNGFLLLFFLEVVVFYADVPFINQEQLYIILRMGKGKWYLKQAFYIIESSFIIIIISFFLCLVRLTPILKFQLSWDRVLGTLALTDAGQQFSVLLSIPYKILNRYEPAEAFLYSILVGWGVLAFIGMFMFCVSLYWSRRTAVITMTAMILLFGIQDYYTTWCRYLLPLSWVQITELGVRYSEFAPTQNYVIRMLPMFLMLLFIVGFLCIKKKDFDYMEEE